MAPDGQQAEPSLARPRSNLFRHRRKGPPQPPQDARRQGAISTLAFQLLGGRDPALDFLNSDNARLGGRPIAIATQSESGYAAVEREIRTRSAAQGA